MLSIIFQIAFLLTASPESQMLHLVQWWECQEPKKDNLNCHPTDQSCLVIPGSFPLLVRNLMVYTKFCNFSFLFDHQFWILPLILDKRLKTMDGGLTLLSRYVIIVLSSLHSPLEGCFILVPSIRLYCHFSLHVLLDCLIDSLLCRHSSDYLTAFSATFLEVLNP